MPLLEAAYHEAGHIICTEYCDGVVFPPNSKYSISESDISGFADVATRLSRGGDKASTEDLVTVFCAGFAAEVILHSINPAASTANKETSKPDFDLASDVLKRKQLSPVLDNYIAKAEEILKCQWGKVDKLAQHILATPQGSVLQTLDRLNIINQDKE